MEQEVQKTIEDIFSAELGVNVSVDARVNAREMTGNLYVRCVDSGSQLSPSSPAVVFMVTEEAVKCVTGDADEKQRVAMGLLRKTVRREWDVRAQLPFDSVIRGVQVAITDAMLRTR